MTTGAFFHIKVSARRLLRAVILAVMLTLAGLALASGSAWIKVLGPPRILGQHVAIWFLTVVLDSYFWIWTAALLGGVVSGWSVWQMRRLENEHRRLPVRLRSTTKRCLL